MIAGVVRAAAIQLEPRIADVAANLEACEQLADEAADAGAQWIALPEFFTTGVCFDERLANAAVAPDGAATELLRNVARRRSVTIGGSFLCRDSDGEVRNAYLLATPEGEIAGRHDKDLPTMWENCFYIGGQAGDDGVIDVGEVTAGVAVCWEFMRTRTARRLRGRVDLISGGSCWWSMPSWPPRAVWARWEATNARTAAEVASAMARLVGAPVLHAAHCGTVECPMPSTPFTYRGHLQGGAVIVDAGGEVLARRDAREGPGLAIADVEPRRTEPLDEIPDRFWLHRRGLPSALTWSVQRAHGRPWYRRHVRGRPPLEVERPRREKAGA